MTPLGALLGRDAESAVWRRLRDEVAGGTGRMLVFSGRPGIGKSALLDLVAAESSAQGWTVLRAENDRVTQHLPGHVVWQWFARLGQQATEETEPFDGPGGLVRRFVRREQLDLEPAALAFAVAWVVRSLAEPGPVALVVDDVQWADDLSLQVLSALATLIGDEAFLLALGARTDPAEPWSEGVEALVGRSRSEHVRLSPLRHRDIAAWARLSMGHASREAVLRIQIASAGVPYYVRELIEAVRTGEIDATDDDGGLGDHSAQELLVERIDDLERQDRSVLRAIAILGDQAIDEHVGPLTGLGPDELERSYLALREQRLIAHDLPLRVTHSLVSSATLDRLAASERSALRAAAVEILREAGGRPSVIAAFLLETLPDDDPRVAEALLAAGREALALGSADTASSLLSRALRQRELPSSLRTEIATASGAALLARGRADEAIETWTDVLSTGRLTSLERIERISDIGDAHYYAGRLAAGADAFAEAARIAHGSDDLPHGARSRALVRMASTTFLTPAGLDLQSTRLAELLAQDGADDTTDDRILLVQESLRRSLAGEPVAETAPLAARALAGTTLLAELSTTGPILPMGIAALVYCERDAEAYAILDAALTSARRSGSVFGHAQLVAVRGFLHFFRGRLRLAQADFEAAFAARDVGLSPYLEASVNLLTQVLIEREELDAARTLVEHTPLDDTKPEVVRALRLDSHARLLAAVDDHEGALAMFTQASDLTEPYGGHQLKHWDRALVASAVALGRTRHASAVASTLLESAARIGAPRVLGAALRTAALADPFPVAVSRLREAIALLGPHEGRYEHALALGDLAALLDAHAHGDEERRREAADLARRAVGLGEQIGARALVRRASRLAGDRDAPGPAGGSLVDRLSASELGVCRLAAQGLTNRQVAEHLFITVKGVEWHLSRSYAKLGIRSRRELTDHLGELTD